ncbi:MAG: PAS domain-containing protein, partial [Pseudomonadota bacterium]
MRIPPLAIVFLVSCALFAWHGFDKYQTVKQLHSQTLNQALDRAISTIDQELDRIHARAQTFEPGPWQTVNDMRAHFPLAQGFGQNNNEAQAIQIFGSLASKKRCDTASPHPVYSNTFLCTSDWGAPVIRITRSVDGQERHSAYVRYADDWLRRALEPLATPEYIYTLVPRTSIGSAHNTVQREISGTPLMIVLAWDGTVLSEQRDAIARDVLLALAVFLLIAASGMQFIRTTEKREVRLEQLLSNAMRATGETVWEYTFATNTVSVPFTGRHSDGTDTYQHHTASQWLELIHPEDREGVADVLNSIKAGEDHLIHSECRILDTDGAWVWAEIRGNISERDENGNPLTAIGVTTDISRRKAVERKLHYLTTQTANTTGVDFFDSLILALNEVTSISHAFISELDEPNGHTRSTISFLAKGELLPPTELPIQTTPCEVLFDTREVVTFHDNLAERFSDCKTLRDWGVESYIGLPLHNAEGDMIGNIALFHEEPLSIDPAVLDALQLHAQRVGAELE